MFELIKIDNSTSVGNKELGNISYFKYNGTVFYFGLIISSTVQSILKNEDELIVTTKNSVYTFIKVN